MACFELETSQFVSRSTERDTADQFLRMRERLGAGSWRTLLPHLRWPKVDALQRRRSTPANRVEHTAIRFDQTNPMVIAPPCLSDHDGTHVLSDHRYSSQALQLMLGASKVLSLATDCLSSSFIQYQ